MYRKDYILRMVEMFGAAIAAILGLIKKGKFSEVPQNIENAYLDFFQKEAAFFNNIPKDQLTHQLIQEHHYTNQHLEILAHLFYAQAELGFAQNKKKECLPYAEKALLLFKFIDSEYKTYSQERVDLIYKIENIISTLH